MNFWIELVACLLLAVIISMQLSMVDKYFKELKEILKRIEENTKK